MRSRGHDVKTSKKLLPFFCCCCGVFSLTIEPLGPIEGLKHKNAKKRKERTATSKLSKSLKISGALNFGLIWDLNSTPMTLRSWGSPQYQEIVNIPCLIFDLLFVLLLWRKLRRHQAAESKA